MHTLAFVAGGAAVLVAATPDWLHRSRVALQDYQRALAMIAIVWQSGAV